MQKWESKNQENMVYVGLVEFQAEDQEWHNFEIYQTEDEKHFIFGGHCNTGLLESGNFLIDDCFCIDTNLTELISNLETFYNEGIEECSDSFSCNDRM